MNELPSPKTYKCQIAHEGERISLNCWNPESSRKIRASVLIIHDICEGLNVYKEGIIKLIGDGYRVYAFHLKVDNPVYETVDDNNSFPNNFRDFTVEILQIIAYIKNLEKGVAPFLLTQGLGALIGLINTRKHASFVRGYIACSPMFQLRQKIVPLKRLTIKTLSDFAPGFTLPSSLTPRFTSHRKVVVNGLTTKIEAKVSSREAYEYLKAMSQARKNFSKISTPTLLICPDHNHTHKYSFLKNAIAKHKYEKQIEFINLHTKYHAIASDRSDVLETYDRYIIPWLNRIIAEENVQSDSKETSHSSNKV